ncbi:MAG: phage tail fiber protein [Phycisphaerales bacterium]
MTTSSDLVKSILPSYSVASPTTDFTGDGSTTTFTFAFDYLDRTTYSTKSSYIKVYTGATWDTLSEYSSWTQSGQYAIVISPAPANGTAIRIQRDSTPYQLLSSFVDGSRITGETLNLAVKQSIFAAYENYTRLLDIKDRLDFLEGGAATNGGVRFTFVGTGAQTAFTLTGQTGLSASNILCNVGGTVQTNNLYSVSDVAGVSTVTFTSAPSNGAKVDVYVLVGASRVLAIPDAGSVGTTALADGGVTFAKTNFNATGSNGQALMRRSGSWGASTIVGADVSDLAAVVQTNRLDQFATPTGSVAMGSQKITGLLAGVSGTDATNLTQVTNLITAAVPATLANLKLVSGPFPVTDTNWSVLSLGWQPDCVLLIMSGFTDVNGKASPPYVFTHSLSLHGTDARTVVPTTYVGSTYLSAGYSFQLLSTGWQMKKISSFAVTPSIVYVALKNYP